MRIQVKHVLPEHSEACETIHIPTAYDYTDWNKEHSAWQCQYCQRFFNRDTNRWEDEDELYEWRKWQ